MRIVKAENNIKIGFFLFLYIVGTALSFIIADFSRYNPFVLLFFAIGAFFFLPKLGSKSILLFVICSVSVLLADFILGVRFIYTGISIANIFFVLSSFSQVQNIVLSSRQLKKILVFCSILLLLFLVGMLSESLYSTQDDINHMETLGQLRYQGLFHAANQSSSIVLMLIVLSWEASKYLFRNNAKILKIILIFLLVFFVLYYFQSKTRTLLLALPYFAYQIFKISNIKYLIAFCTLALGFVIYKLDDFAFDATSMRLGEDSSSVTRSYLYLSEIDKITETNVLLPKGSHTMADYVVKLMGDDDYSPHNDFLRYIHDWGGVFFLIIIAMYKYLKRNIDTILIVLLYAGCALHNILLSPYVLFPLMLVLIINYKYDREGHKRQRIVVDSQKV